jgi:hypothetical protein
MTFESNNCAVIRKSEYSGQSLFHKKDYQPTSWLPILTTTVNGNGDMPAASVIGGTTPLPRSDEVYVTKVWIVLIKVVVSVLLKVRSKRNKRLMV